MAQPPHLLHADGAKGDASIKKLVFDDVAKHNTASDCWVIINNKAYDLTDFAQEHPGGSAIVTEQAGKDATAEFLDAHPEDIMTLTLGKKGLAAAFRGDVVPSTIPKVASVPKAAAKAKEDAEGSSELPIDDEGAPPLDLVLNLHDFEAIAQRVMHARGRKQAWDYYSSGADDELTYNENVNVFQRVWLKPRILVDVAKVDTSTRILGLPVRMPLYLSAVAMCGMGHPDGELAWARAAHAQESLFMVPILSSKPFSSIVNVSASENSTEPTGQPFFFQIYVNPDREVVKDQLRACEKANVKALCITVDSAVPGKRERDLRNKLAMQVGRAAQQNAAAAGTKARKPGSFANRDPALCWKDIEWFKANTSIPLVIKGVQCGEDAVLAAKIGARAIVLSNHGGRNLDTSRSGLEVLPEVMKALEYEGLKGKIEVYVDGGIRRGTDVLKAIALGATAVGLGKPAVYAMSGYGQAGIEKMLEILHAELVVAMRLVGAASIADLKPSMVNCDDLTRHTVVAPLPPSPFVVRAPLQNVRSPPPIKATDSQSAAEVRAEIAKLQQQLAKLEPARSGTIGVGGATVSAAARGELPQALADFGALLRAVIVAVLRTVFSRSASGMLHRSAIFLIVFLVVHMLGNLTVFGGAKMFNAYGDALSRNPAIKFIEYYLLLAAVVHAAMGVYFTNNKRRLIAKQPFARHSVLLGTSLLVTVFIVLHLRTFRFSDAVAVGADGVRDLYSAQLELFRDRRQVAFYLASLAALGVHLWFGWTKTVLKFDVDKHKRALFVKMGHALVWPLFIGFALCPLYSHWLHIRAGTDGSVSDEL